MVHPECKSVRAWQTDAQESDAQFGGIPVVCRHSNVCEVGFECRPGFKQDYQPSNGYESYSGLELECKLDCET